MGTPLEKRSAQVRKYIESHKFADENGEEYSASSFNGFGDYMRRKKIKLQNLDAQIRAGSSEEQRGLFRGVVAHVNGYTQPSLQVLHRLLVQQGAGFLQYLDNKTMVTHIIASALTPKKQKEFAKYRVVKPAWVTDSIAAGKMLPWTNYRVIFDNVRQRTLALGGPGDETGADEKGKGKAVLSENAKKEVGSVYQEMSMSGYYGSQIREALQVQLQGQMPRLATITSGVSAPPRLRSVIMTEPVSKTPTSWSTTKTLQLSEKKVERKEPLSSDLRPTTPPVDPGFLSFEIPEDVINKEEEKMQQNLTTRPSTLERSSTPVQQLTTFRQPATPAVSTPVKQMITTKPTTPVKSPVNAIFSPQPRIPLPPNPTPEQYNAWLLSDPRYAKSSTANPDFLRQFYSESRLHHLSMWKADLKSKLTRLASQTTADSGKLGKLPKEGRRYVFHVDFDSFFCAVSLLKRPELKDRSVVVAHSAKSSSEISSCNYPARAFGVKNGMWVKTALELCPELTVLPYDFPAYEEASEKFYTAVIGTGGIIQSVSIDEALIEGTRLIFDATGTDGVGPGEDEEQMAAESLAMNLRAQIKLSTKCDVSIGISSNILLAKLALRKAKPAGQYLLRPLQVPEFLAPLAVGSLPGVSGSITSKLAEIDVTTVGDVRRMSREQLSTLLGPKMGERLWEFVRGVDHSEVGVVPMRKSVSVEINWGIRFMNQGQAESFVHDVCRELERRLVNENVKGTNLILKIMRRAPSAPLEPVKHLGHGICDIFNKSVVLRAATNDVETMAREAVSLLRGWAFSPGDIRGVGIQMSKLVGAKVGAEGMPMGSQKILDFSGVGVKKRKASKVPRDERPVVKRMRMKRDLDRESAIPDAESESSLFKHPGDALAEAPVAVSPPNIPCSQFILPSDADHSVIAELPPDVRARLLGTLSQVTSLEPLSSSRLPSPPPPTSIPSLPPPAPRKSTTNFIPQSQIDPEVFAALPEDVKAEILASYQQQPQPQPQLPRILSSRQSPQRPCIRQATMLTKRQNRIQARERMKDVWRGLYQARLSSTGHFDVGSRESTASPSCPKVDAKRTAVEGIDENVLMELPADVRAEILAERERKWGLRAAVLSEEPKHAHAPHAEEITSREAPVYTGPTLTFPTPPQPILFAMCPGTSEDDFLATISSWVHNTRARGPHIDDIDLFCEYIKHVILDEIAIDKAVRLVEWLKMKVAGLERTRDVGVGVVEAWWDGVGRVRRVVGIAGEVRGMVGVEI